MYNIIVSRRVRALWRRVGSGDFMTAVKLASDDVTFTFVGSTILSDSFLGRDLFQAWFQRLFVLFPGLSITLVDVVSQGVPWDTRVAVRLDIAATLADGSPYRNQAVQWMRLRWGRLMDDWVIEDTQALARACAIQTGQ